MATYIQNYWQPQVLDAVSALQNMSGAGELLLNGTYYDPPTPTISFVNQGFVRQVSLTSTNDLSAATFTVYGIQNNYVITESLAGPNNNTVYTTNSFDIITKITVDGAVTGIKAGTGLSGYFPIIGRISPTALLISVTNVNYSLAFATESSNGCTYSIYQSLADKRNLGETYDSMIADSTFIPIGSPYSNVTQILQEADVSNNILISVTSALAGSTLNMEFLQYT